MSADLHHWHKCAVYECAALIPCWGDCERDEVSEPPCCGEHMPLWEALRGAIGQDTKLVQVFAGGIPKEFRK